MIELTLIGIGTGSPGHLTREAVAAMAASDLIVIPDKGMGKADLADLRRAMVAQVLPSPPPIAGFTMPARDDAAGYRQGVKDWHDAIAGEWESTIRAHGAIRPSLLVWGDPSLYDSTLRIAAQVAQRMPLHLRVVPGITAIQALCAAHAIPLNDVGDPVVITTGRQLRDHGWPVGNQRVVVMLDGDCAFQGLDSQGIQIWWGAYLGMPQQMLRSGPLDRIGPDIVAARAKARAAHGWIMDIYLLDRAPAAPCTSP